MIKWGRVNVDKLLLKAEEYDQEYLETTTRAIERYVHSGRARELMLQFISRENRGEYSLANPYAKQAWLKQLLTALVHVPQADLESWEDIKYCALVTFVDEDWAWPEGYVHFDLARAQKRVRNALRGLTFVGNVEVAFYPAQLYARDGQEGSLLSFHFHVLVFASSRSSLMRRIKKVRKRFKPIRMLGAKSGVKTSRRKTVAAICRSARYAGKMHGHGYRYLPEERRRQRKFRLSQQDQLRLFNVIRHFDVRKTWFAGGLGSRILKTANLHLPHPVYSLGPSRGQSRTRKRRSIRAPVRFATTLFRNLRRR